MLYFETSTSYTHPSIQIRIRKDATYTLAHIKDNVSVDLLSSLESIDLTADDHDDLKGNILRCLYPHSLSLSDVMARLVPEKRSNYLGSYGMFIEYEFAENLEAITTEENAELLLGWSNQHILNDEFDKVGELARKIFSSYWRKGSELSEKAVTLLADGFLKTAAEYRSPFTCREYQEPQDGYLSAEEFEKDINTRRRILTELVTKEHPNTDKALHIFSTRYPIINEDDVPWLIEKVLSSTNRKSESKWYACLDALIRLDVLERHLEQFRNLHDTKPELLESPESIIKEIRKRKLEHEADQKKWGQEREERKIKGQQNQAEIDDNIKKLLASEELRPNHFRWLSQVLCTKEGRYVSASVNLTISPGWQKLTEAEKSILIQLAEDYLRHGDISKTEEGSFNLITASALYLLYKCSNQSFLRLDEEVWARSFEEFIKVGDIYNDDCIQPLLDQFVSICPELATLKLVGRTQIEADSRVCSTLRLWNKRLTEIQAQQIIEELDWTKMSNEGQLAVLEELSKSTDTRPVESFLGNLIDKDATNPPAIKLAQHLALVYKLNPIAYGEVIISWIEKETRWGKQWVRSVVGHWESLLQSGIVHSELSVIRRFYIWLHYHYPSNKEPHHDGAYTPTAIDNIYQLKSSIVSHIVNCGVTGSADTFREILSHFPEDDWLKSCIIDAYKNGFFVKSCGGSGFEV